MRSTTNGSVKSTWPASTVRTDGWIWIRVIKISNAMLQIIAGTNSGSGPTRSIARRSRGDAPRRPTATRNAAEVEKRAVRAATSSEFLSAATIAAFRKATPNQCSVTPVNGNAKNGDLLKEKATRISAGKNKKATMSHKYTCAPIRPMEARPIFIFRSRLTEVARGVAADEAHRDKEPHQHEQQDNCERAAVGPVIGDAELRLDLIPEEDLPRATDQIRRHELPSHRHEDEDDARDDPRRGERQHDLPYNAKRPRTERGRRTKQIGIETF